MFFAHFYFSASGRAVFTGVVLCFVLFFAHFYFSASGRAVFTGVVPSLPRLLPLQFSSRIGFSNPNCCSSSFHRVLLTHAPALYASQFVRKKKSPRYYTSMHSAGFELTKLTYTRLKDNLIRHRGDRKHWQHGHSETNSDEKCYLYRSMRVTVPAGLL